MTVYMDFDRSLMQSVHAAVKTRRPNGHLYKDAWVWCGGRGHWEFHGPDKFYWHGRANSAYHARAQGWSAWMLTQPDVRGDA